MTARATGAEPTSRAAPHDSAYNNGAVATKQTVSNSPGAVIESQSRRDADTIINRQVLGSEISTKNVPLRRLPDGPTSEDIANQSIGTETKDKMGQLPGQGESANAKSPEKIAGVNPGPSGVMAPRRAESRSFLLPNNYWRNIQNTWNVKARLREEVKLKDNEIGIRNEEIHRLNALLERGSHKIDALRDQLEEQGKQLRIAQQVSFRSMENGKWVTREDSTIRSDLAKFESELRSWARKFASPDLSTFEQASADWQEQLTYALVDSVRAKDPRTPCLIYEDRFKGKAPQLLIHAMLASFIMKKVYKNPFFFFQYETATLEGVPLNNGLSPHRENGFGKSLDALYREMMRVNAPGAHLWRSETLRLLNTANGCEQSASPQPIKSRITEMRKRMSERLASEFLRGPVGLLLRPNLTYEEGCMVTNQLTNIIFNAGENSMNLWMQRTNMVMFELRNCGKFNLNNPFMTAHRLHQLDDDDHRLDGKPIIAVIQPGVVAFGDNDGENYEKYKVWSKAVVMVYDS
ncbi:hypothetical protein FQN54_005884 [Arachnomyces sp. PD_36]|nr:hypothetical protein FQN54_005884 [Arachnomyces sp. PD_36]